jgi:glycosyltransferase 2 family protein
MKKKAASLLKFLILLAVAGTLLYFSFKGMSIGKILQQLREANVFWLALSIIISIGAHISRAYRWKLLIEPLGYDPPLKKTFYSLMVGYFANLAFPRLGEVTRCGSLNKTESIPFSSLIGTVIVERAVDVLTLLACMVLTVIVEYKKVGGWLTEKIIQPMVAKLQHAITSPLFITGIVLFIVAIVIAIRYFKKRTSQSSKESRVANFIKELVKGIRSIANLKRPGQFIFHSVLIWIFYFFSTYVTFFAFPNSHALGLGAGLLSLVLASVAMSAPVQGGIGVYHLLVSEGLMFYGLSREDGLTIATFLHTSQMAVVIVLGSISLFLLFLENKNKSRAEPKPAQNQII